MPVLTLPEYYERVLFLGTNGSGKSVLAFHMLSRFPRWVAIDSKGDAKIPGGVTYTLIRRPNDPRWKWSERILYRPTPEYNTGEWFDEIMHRLYVRAQKQGRKKPFIIYVDEGLLNAKFRHTQWLAAHAVAGRSLNVGLWLSSQRPKWIPVEIRSEAWRTYIFYLQRLDDRKEIVGDSGGQITLEDLADTIGDYSFWEIRRLKGGRQVVTHYPPLAIE